MNKEVVSGCEFRLEFYLVKCRTKLDQFVFDRHVRQISYCLRKASDLARISNVVS